jgi:signal transduction histidine kinase/DNA-binding NarL/FixJ family response regulator
MKSHFITFCLATLLCSLCMGLELVAFRILHAELPFMPLAIALVASGFGFWPALYAALFSMIGEVYFFIEPVNSIQIATTYGALKFALYSIISLFLCYRLGIQKKVLNSLQHLVQRQEVWAATVSHEIRTPLNGILGFIRILQDSAIDAEQGRHLHLMEKSAQRLKSLVSDILDFSQIQSGKIVVEKFAFNPENEIRTIIDILKPKAQEKGLFIALEVEGIVNFVLGDARKFSQVFINLLDNAIKFGRQGRIQIGIHSQSQGNHQQKLQISVEDFGMGISELEQKHVFEPFYRGQDLISEGIEGTGLGLSIVRQLVGAMKGQIKLISQQGEGTCFLVELTFPLAKQRASVHRSKIDIRAARTQVQTGALPLALVAEDNHISQIVIQKFLEKLGYRVDLVEDGLQAVDAAKKHLYNLIVVDRFMPQLNGFDAAKKIRQIYEVKKFQDFDILGTTADMSFECRRLAEESGIQNLLLKPVDFLDLKNLVSSFYPLAPGLNYQQLTLISHRLGESASKEILRLFLNESPVRQRVILEMIENGRQQELADFVHNLKSSCLAIGAAAAADICTGLEKLARDQKSENLFPLVNSLISEMQQCETQIREQLHL